MKKMKKPKQSKAQPKTVVRLHRETVREIANLLQAASLNKWKRKKGALTIGAHLRGFAELCMSYGADSLATALGNLSAEAVNLSAEADRDPYFFTISRKYATNELEEGLEIWLMGDLLD